MQTIAEDPDGQAPSMVMKVMSVPQHDGIVMIRGSTTGGGFRSATPLSSSGCRRAAAPAHALPRSVILDLQTLNVNGERVIAPPPPGILQHVHGTVAGRNTDDCARQSSPSRTHIPGGEQALLGDKEALKYVIKRKRSRARKQKVAFTCVSPTKGDAVDASAHLPHPALYMPAYVAKSKSRSTFCKVKKSNGLLLGADVRGSGMAHAESDGEDEFVALTSNKPLLSRAPLDLDIDADELGLNYNKTEIRHRVTAAIRQVRPMVLRHILLRNKLIDGSTQLNVLLKENLVALVISSHNATRELLRSPCLQNAAGGNLVLDAPGIESLNMYKKFIEMEPTPRPVSDTYNQVCVAGPGLFQRNRFPPGVTTLERLTWWERQADQIFEDYATNQSIRQNGGAIPTVDGWSSPEGKERTWVMFDEKHRMRKVKERGKTPLKMPVTPFEDAEAMELAMQAEAELQQAIATATSAKENLSRAQARSRCQTSFSMASQHIDSALGPVAGTRSSWPRTPGSHRAVSCGNGEEGECRTAADSRRLSPSGRNPGSPLRFRAREEDRQRGWLSPSRFMNGGEFQPEYVQKNTFTGARRVLCIRAGLPYADSTYDHLNTLLMQKTPKLRSTAEQPDTTPALPTHLLALKNIGTRRWRKAYERGTTDFVSDAAQVKQYLNPRDSKIFDLWGADKQPPPPPLVPRVETPIDLKSQQGGGKEWKVHTMHIFHFSRALSFTLAHSPPLPLALFALVSLALSLFLYITHTHFHTRRCIRCSCWASLSFVTALSTVLRQSCIRKIIW